MTGGGEEWADHAVKNQFKYVPNERKFARILYFMSTITDLFPNLAT